MLSPSRCRQVARFVMVWFVLALGTAAASPLVRTQERQLVCTAAGGFQFVGIDDDGAARATGGLQDCPLCVLAGAPPQRVPLPVLRPRADAALASMVAHGPWASRSAPPLPARGPPTYL